MHEIITPFDEIHWNLQQCFFTFLDLCALQRRKGVARRVTISRLKTWSDRYLTLDEENYDFTSEFLDSRAIALHDLHPGYMRMR